MSHEIRVEVWIFFTFKGEGYEVFASKDKPCKIALPFLVAKEFVDQGLAEYCHKPKEGECPQCPKGAPGAQGMTGKFGEDGQRGIDGEDGEDGQNGRSGRDGEPGVRGAQGLANLIRGPKGECGDKGPDGDDGAPGNPGMRGIDGAPGGVGNPGAPGKQGVEGAPGAPGAKGVSGTPGADGNNGLPGTDGKICPNFFECIDLGDGSYQFITRDANCDIVSDVIWKCSESCWRREYEVEIDFDGTDYKVRDDDNGFAYDVPLGNGESLLAEFTFGIPSVQPCRDTACGHTINPYETTFPNINAYGPDQGGVRDCVWVPMQLCFDKNICGEVTINFFDVDKSFNILGTVCEEKIRVTDSGGGTLVAGGDLVETAPGSNIFEPAASQGEGDTNTNGSITFQDIASAMCFSFEVQIFEGFSVGFGFSGTQTIKIEQRGTYKGNTFFDEMGNEIAEPVGWVDVPCT